jgi:hypothetical protein
LRRIYAHKLFRYGLNIYHAEIWYDRTMKHTENNIEPDYLEAERLRLLDWVAVIQASGKVAPAYCWLIESSEEKGSRTYTYIKLITQKPGKRLTAKSLGRPGSDRHRQWKTAIARREAIAELEQQLKMLDALIERQDQALQLAIVLDSL